MSIEIPIDIVGLVEMVIGQTVTLIGRVVLRLRGRYDLLVGVTRTGREADDAAKIQKISTGQQKRENYLEESIFFS